MRWARARSCREVASQGHGSRRADGKTLGRDPRGTREVVFGKDQGIQGDFFFFLRPSHLRLDIWRLRRILFRAFSIRVTLTAPLRTARKPPSIRASSPATCVAPGSHSVISRGLLSLGRGQSPREELRNASACLHACFSLPLAPNNSASTKPRRVSCNQKNPGTLLRLLSAAQKFFLLSFPPVQRPSSPAAAFCCCCSLLLTSSLESRKGGGLLFNLLSLEIP